MKHYAHSRLVAFAALTALFASAAIFSKQFVFFKDDDESGRSLLRGVDGDAADEGRRLGFVLFGQEHPYLDMKETTIYVSVHDAFCSVFVLLHSCLWLIIRVGFTIARQTENIWFAPHLLLH